MTSFDEARAVAEEAVRLVFQGRFEEAEALAADDLELITREGPRHGQDAIAYLKDFWRPQRETFEIEHTIERIIDAGDGTVVVFNVVRRIAKPPDTGEIKAWPAHVIRVRNGRVVFLEGYVDRRGALRALGLPADA